MAVSKLGIALLLPLLIINFCLNVVLLGLAGWAFDEIVERELTSVNAATPFLCSFSIITGILGVTCVVIGIQVLQGKQETNPTATAVGLATFGFSIAALGFASKQKVLGGTHSKKMKALEAFAIIVAFFQLLYLVVPHITLLLKSKAPNTAPSEPLSKSEVSNV